MATVGAGSRNWDKLITKSEVDNSTGNTRVYIQNQREEWVQIAETYFEDDPDDPSGEPQKINKWKYSDSIFAQGLPVLTTQYNRANGTNLTQSQINKLFFTNEIPKYNNDRAAVLNNNNNYANANEAAGKRSRFVLNTLVPGVTDPETGSTVNNSGQGTNTGTGTVPPPVVLPSPEQTQEANGTVETDPSLTGQQTGAETSSTIQTEADKTVVRDIQVKEKNLRYPLEEPPPGLPYDFIRISSYKYVAGGVNFSPGSQTNVVNRYSASKDQQEITSVILPMQPNLSESNSVDWGGDTLDPVKGALANLSMGSAKGIAETDFNQIQESFGKAAETTTQMLSDDNLKNYVFAYFAGQAVGSNIQARATGQVINPNMELLFSGPRMRTFNFDFRLTPRRKEEAEMIKKIIRSFKMNMAPQRSSSNLFLLSPNIFKLEYIFSDKGNTQELHPYLNKFKPCAMTNFTVNYTPDGSYATYGEDGSLTSYAISMSFSELEPIYQDDYAEDYNSHQTMGY